MAWFAIGKLSMEEALDVRNSKKGKSGFKCYFSFKEKKEQTYTVHIGRID
jgi:hypothetical protein